MVSAMAIILVKALGLVLEEVAVKGLGLEDGFGSKCIFL
jgi:hypothetical protein